MSTPLPRQQRRAAAAPPAALLAFLAALQGCAGERAQWAWPWHGEDEGRPLAPLNATALPAQREAGARGDRWRALLERAAPPPRGPEAEAARRLVRQVSRGVDVMHELDSPVARAAAEAPRDCLGTGGGNFTLGYLPEDLDYYAPFSCELGLEEGGAVGLDVDGPADTTMQGLELALARSADWEIQAGRAVAEHELIREEVRRLEDAWLSEAAVGRPNKERLYTGAALEDFKRRLERVKGPQYARGWGHHVIVDLEEEGKAYADVVKANSRVVMEAWQDWLVNPTWRLAAKFVGVLRTRVDSVVSELDRQRVVMDKIRDEMDTARELLSEGLRFCSFVDVDNFNAAIMDTVKRILEFQPFGKWSIAGKIIKKLKAAKDFKRIVKESVQALFLEATLDTHDDDDFDGEGVGPATMRYLQLYSQGRADSNLMSVFIDEVTKDVHEQLADELRVEFAKEVAHAMKTRLAERKGRRVVADDGKTLTQMLKEFREQFEFSLFSENPEARRLKDLRNYKVNQYVNSLEPFTKSCIDEDGKCVQAADSQCPIGCHAQIGQASQTFPCWQFVACNLHNKKDILPVFSPDVDTLEGIVRHNHGEREFQQKLVQASTTTKGFRMMAKAIKMAIPRAGDSTEFKVTLAVPILSTGFFVTVGLEGKAMRGRQGWSRVAREEYVQVRLVCHLGGKLDMLVAKVGAKMSFRATAGSYGPGETGVDRAMMIIWYMLYNRFKVFGNKWDLHKWFSREPKLRLADWWAGSYGSPLERKSVKAEAKAAAYEEILFLNEADKAWGECEIDYAAMAEAGILVASLGVGAGRGSLMSYTRSTMLTELGDMFARPVVNATYAKRRRKWDGDVTPTTSYHFDFKTTLAFIGFKGYYWSHSAQDAIWKIKVSSSLTLPGAAGEIETMIGKMLRSVMGFMNFARSLYTKLSLWMQKKTGTIDSEAALHAAEGISLVNTPLADLELQQGGATAARKAPSSPLDAVVIGDTVESLIVDSLRGALGLEDGATPEFAPPPAGSGLAYSLYLEGYKGWAYDDTGRPVRKPPLTLFRMEVEHTIGGTVNLGVLNTELTNTHPLFHIGVQLHETNWSKWCLVGGALGSLGGLDCLGIGSASRSARGHPTGQAGTAHA